MKPGLHHPHNVAATTPASAPPVGAGPGSHSWRRLAGSTPRNKPAEWHGASRSRHHLVQAVLGLAALQVTQPLAAAAQSPSIDVLGSYFPAWLICIVLGLVLTVIARLLFIAWNLESHLFPKPIVYPCLIAVFAMTVWLLIFRN